MRKALQPAQGVGVPVLRLENDERGKLPYYPRLTGYAELCGKVAVYARDGLQRILPVHSAPSFPSTEMDTALTVMCRNIGVQIVLLRS